MPARAVPRSRWEGSPLSSLVLARIVHVFGVVFWIGGVAFVTTVLIPAIRKLPGAAERLQLFQQLEGRFAMQARVATLLTGGSGLYMLHGMDAWSRYLDPAFWWVHLMTFVWLAFTLVLFILEPAFLHRKVSPSWPRVIRTARFVSAPADALDPAHAEPRRASWAPSREAGAFCASEAGAACRLVALLESPVARRASCRRHVRSSRSPACSRRCGGCLNSGRHGVAPSGSADRAERSGPRLSLAARRGSMTWRTQGESRRS